MKNNKKAFLLCAGKATRFYPHSQILPKPLLPFLNLPLVLYNLNLLKMLGVNELVANTHVHPQLLGRSLKKLAKKAGLSLPLLSYEPKLLGSAGGLFKVKNFLETEEHFFYLNGDSFIWPEKKSQVLDFYSQHIKSQALVSFLVCPSKSQSQQVKLQSQKAKSQSQHAKYIPTCLKGYDFSGLALFSKKIFNILKKQDFHIFHDVLCKPALEPYLRVHSVSNLMLLDMNHLKAYLNSTKKALHVLQKKTPASLFLSKILDLYSPAWRCFDEGNCFSATRLESRLTKSKKSILFCGKNVKGLKNLSFKGFAVIGDKACIAKPLCMDQSVLAHSITLKNPTTHKLIIS